MTLIIICYYLKIFTAKLWSWWIKQGLIGLQMFFSFMMMPNKNVRVFSFLSFQSEHRWGGDRCGRHREQTRQGTWDHSSNAFGHMRWLLILTHHANLMFIYLRTYWSFLKCKEIKNMTVIIRFVKEPIHAGLKTLNPCSDCDSLARIRRETG